MTVLMLELNELNFNHVRKYIKLGKLPNLAKLLNDHALIETTSEQSYEELEPWIQWVTAHTGLPLAEHGIFRLGDIINSDLPQIWEVLEANGLKVGAMSPMNAKNRCKNAAFFMPDPWTPTAVTGSALMKYLNDAVSQAVNDNAKGRITLRSALTLIVSLAVYARPCNYKVYLNIISSILGRASWASPLLLDQLLADLFVRKVRRKKPNFATLFLNAGAHIQHHYMFNAKVYSGPFSNPAWYVNAKVDPVLEVYTLYDRIVGQIKAIFPTARLMLATGLHQDPHNELTFYWRLKNHADFLQQARIDFDRVEPRMSRDFVIYCSTPEQASLAEYQLRQIRSVDGTELFDVDNRGDSLFVMLTWASDITDAFEYIVGNEGNRKLREQVAFVAIKNGAHNGIGYLIDTGEGFNVAKSVPLASLPQRIASACGVSW
jgi:hypothetical protein